MFVERVDTEANLAWTRANYFLVVISILAVAYIQNPTIVPHVAIFRLLVALAGMSLTIVWIFMHHRGSNYVKYNKKIVRELAKKAQTPEPFPDDIGGFETRMLGYWFPIIFLFFWIALIVLASLAL